MTPQASENGQPRGMECIGCPSMLAEGVKFSLKLLKHDFQAWIDILPIPLRSMFRRGRQQAVRVSLNQHLAMRKRLL